MPSIPHNILISPIRLEVYRQLQEWKREIFVPSDLNVSGMVLEAMRLSDSDLVFIEQETAKILGGVFLDEQPKPEEKKADMISDLTTNERP